MRAAGLLVAAMIAVVGLELFHMCLVKRFKLPQSLDEASSDFIQRELRPRPAVGNIAPPVVVLLTRRAMGDVIRDSTQDAIFAREDLLRAVHVLACSGTRAIALDFDMGADEGRRYRDPLGDPAFFDSLLRFNRGEDSCCGLSRAVPIVVGVGERSLYPDSTRLGRLEYAPLACSVYAPAIDSNRFRHYLVESIGIGDRRLESLSAWVARRLNPVDSTLDESHWIGFETRIERGLEPESCPEVPWKRIPFDAPRVRYFYPDYSILDTLVGQARRLTSLDQPPSFGNSLKDRVVILSHDELDQEAKAPGHAIGDSRFRNAMLLAAGAWTLRTRPLQLPDWYNRMAITAFLAFASLFGARKLANRVRRPGRVQAAKHAGHALSGESPEHGHWTDFWLACGVAVVLYFAAGALSGFTGVVLDDVLLEVPIIVVLSFVQVVVVGWLFELLRVERAS